MKILDPAILAARQARGGTSSHGLIWLTVKDRATGAPQTMGFWTGDDHQTFVINGVGRTYYGAGNLLAIGDLTSEVGLVIRMLDITLSGLTLEAQQAFKGYDARLAPVELHRAEFDPDTGNLLAEPERVFKGWADKVNWARGAKADDGTATMTCTVTLASASRALTRTLAQKFSDASQKLRSPSDTFFQYVDVSGSATVFWGSKRVASSAVSASANNGAVPSIQKNAGAI